MLIDYAIVNTAAASGISSVLFTFEMELNISTSHLTLILGVISGFACVALLAGVLLFLRRTRRHERARAYRHFADEAVFKHFGWADHSPSHSSAQKLVTPISDIYTARSHQSADLRPPRGVAAAFRRLSGVAWWAPGEKPPRATEKKNSRRMSTRSDLPYMNEELPPLPDFVPYMGPQTPRPSNDSSPIPPPPTAQSTPQTPRTARTHRRLSSLMDSFDFDIDPNSAYPDSPISLGVPITARRGVAGRARLVPSISPPSIPRDTIAGRRVSLANDQLATPLRSDRGVRPALPAWSIKGLHTSHATHTVHATPSRREHQKCQDGEIILLQPPLRQLKLLLAWYTCLAPTSRTTRFGHLPDLPISIECHFALSAQTVPDPYSSYLRRRTRPPTKALPRVDRSSSRPIRRWKS